MKKILKLLMATFLFMGTSIYASEAQNIQIFSVDNTKSTLNAKSIEKAFNASGLVVNVNNNYEFYLFKKIWKSTSQEL